VKKYNDDLAAKIAIDLAKSNVESAQRWVKGEEVNLFIEQVYALLTSDDINEE